MPSDALLEEFEVLESIYPTELSKLSDSEIQIDAEPDDPPDGSELLKVTLIVEYTDGYPDALPMLSLEAVEGSIDDEEIESLLDGLRVAGQENLGMAMTFTLVSHLREQLSALVVSRTEKQRLAEQEKERLAIEAEEARTRGTPVTIESFTAWKANFDKEIKVKKQREEDERMKGMTPKEREEWKKYGYRLSGRQLFERHKNLEEDTLMEEGSVSVDASQYERTRSSEAEEENEGIAFSDSE